MKDEMRFNIHQVFCHQIFRLFFSFLKCFCKRFSFLHLPFHPSSLSRSFSFSPSSELLAPIAELLLLHFRYGRDDSRFSLCYSSCSFFFSVLLARLSDLEEEVNDDSRFSIFPECSFPSCFFVFLFGE